MLKLIQKDEKKAAKKGGKDAPVASSPLEQEKIDLEKGIEFSKTAIVKYGEKKNKITDLKNKLECNNALSKRCGRKWFQRKSILSWSTRQAKENSSELSYSRRLVLS